MYAPVSWVYGRYQYIAQYHYRYGSYAVVAQHCSFSGQHANCCGYPEGFAQQCIRPSYCKMFMCPHHHYSHKALTHGLSIQCMSYYGIGMLQDGASHQPFPGNDSKVDDYERRQYQAIDQCRSHPRPECSVSHTGKIQNATDARCYRNNYFSFQVSFLMNMNNNNPDNLF